MTEHEKFVKICNIIWYTWISETAILGWVKNYPITSIDKKINVREIIFTPEFMDKYISNRDKWQLESVPCESLITTFYKWLMWSIDREWNLHDPVTYLYNTLGLWEKQDKNFEDIIEDTSDVIKRLKNK